MVERFRVLEKLSIFLFLVMGGVLLGASVSSKPHLLPTIHDTTIQAFAYSMPNNGWAPLTVYFSAYGSTDPDGQIVRYEWDLDGNQIFETDSTQTSGYTSYTYAKSGEYLVSVRVWDDQGNHNTASTLVEVRHPASSSVDYWTIFDDSRVKRIDIIVSQQSWDQMWVDPPSKTEVPADVVIFGQRINNIGLSMKGNASLDGSKQKRSWKLDINAYHPEQEYQNLKMLLLHNNFGDPSMLREKMAYDMARFAGVPAAFTTYVEVWFAIGDRPAEYWGVYTMVERPDRKYLANRFGRGNDTGNLYKADAWFEEGAADLAYYGLSIETYPKPRGRIAYRKMTNEALADYDDIIQLCYVIDGVTYETPEHFAAALEQVFNVDSFLRYMSVIWLNLNLDTYPYTGNNYYIYHNPENDRFEWIAWDMNNSWGHFAGDARFPLYGAEESYGPLQYAPLYEKVFEVERYRQDYRAYVDLLLRHWFNQEIISAQTATWHELITPYVMRGDKDYHGETALYSMEAFNSGRLEIIQLTADRERYIESVLSQENEG